MNYTLEIIKVILHIIHLDQEKLDYKMVMKFELMHHKIHYIMNL